ncbi:MAG: bL21 family ribosomal protein, partial [Bacteroides sp.]|nr:bL21 family ribosomal protein [Bacteroides sp.]
MYAIVEINGQQFKAEAGKKLFVHHMQNAEA